MTSSENGKLSFLLCYCNKICNRAYILIELEDTDYPSSTYLNDSLL